MPLSDRLRDHISQLIASDPVVLFMKGHRRAPQCGFSAQVVEILDELLPEYATVDVLSSPELRDGIKEFSQWPTIPQLYVNGQFIGGCDIVRDMKGSGELATLLASVGGTTVTAHKLPTVTLTDAAVAAFRASLGDDSNGEGSGDVLHLGIDARFQYDLYMAPADPKAVRVEVGGLVLNFDAASARRADGLHIDFIDGAGGGFKIKSPQEPPRVKGISPKELEAMRANDPTVEVFDVRTPEERAVAKLSFARHLDDAGGEHLVNLPRETPVVFQCHHGMRSRAAAEHALQAGFKQVYNLEGGIDLWSQTVDPSIPRY
jgi:monothiol glutaredoxin